GIFDAFIPIDGTDDNTFASHDSDSDLPEIWLNSNQSTGNIYLENAEHNELRSFGKFDNKFDDSIINSNCFPLSVQIEDAAAFDLNSNNSYYSQQDIFESTFFSPLYETQNLSGVQIETEQTLKISEESKKENSQEHEEASITDNELHRVINFDNHIVDRENPKQNYASCEQAILGYKRVNPDIECLPYELDDVLIPNNKKTYPDKQTNFHVEKSLLKEKTGVVQNLQNHLGKESIPTKEYFYMLDKTSEISGKLNLSIACNDLIFHIKNRSAMLEGIISKTETTNNIKDMHDLITSTLYDILFFSDSKYFPEGVSNTMHLIQVDEGIFLDKMRKECHKISNCESMELETLQSALKFAEELIELEHRIYLPPSDNIMASKAKLIGFSNSFHNLLEDCKHMHLTELIKLNNLNNDYNVITIKKGFRLYYSFLSEIFCSQFKRIFDRYDAQNKVFCLRKVLNEYDSYVFFKDYKTFPKTFFFKFFIEFIQTFTFYGQKDKIKNFNIELLHLFYETNLFLSKKEICLEKCSNFILKYANQNILIIPLVLETRMNDILGKRSNDHRILLPENPSEISEQHLYFEVFIFRLKYSILFPFNQNNNNSAFLNKILDSITSNIQTLENRFANNLFDAN
ncbi:hypothetical protein CWI37_0076p0010, partial [Hamiltosporidium tvaerminnensis]